MICGHCGKGGHSHYLCPVSINAPECPTCLYHGHTALHCPEGVRLRWYHLLAAAGVVVYLFTIYVALVV